MLDTEKRAHDFALIAMQTRILSEVITSLKTGQSFTHDYLEMYRQTYRDALNAFESENNKALK